MRPLQQTNGYSADARGWLIAEGHRLALAQVGQGDCILCTAANRPPADAEILIEIDGETHRSSVYLHEGIRDDMTFVPFSVR